MAARPLHISSRPVWSRRPASGDGGPHLARSRAFASRLGPEKHVRVPSNPARPLGDRRAVRRAARSATRSGSSCAPAPPARARGSASLVPGTLAGAIRSSPISHSCTSTRTATSTPSRRRPSHYVGGMCLPMSAEGRSRRSSGRALTRSRTTTSRSVEGARSDPRASGRTSIAPSSRASVRRRAGGYRGTSPSRGGGGSGSMSTIDGRRSGRGRRRGVPGAGGVSHRAARRGDHVARVGVPRAWRRDLGYDPTLDPKRKLPPVLAGLSRR